MAIRQMIIEGFGESASFSEVGDRRQAIEDVIGQADARDIVLIAGKGHEAYQEIDGVRHAYRDDGEVLKAFAKRSSD